MTQQSETSDVGHRVHAGEPRQLNAGRIELRGGGNQLAVLRVSHRLLLDRGAVDTHAQRLPQDDLVTRLRVGIALDVPRIDEADGNQPVDGFDRIDAVTAGDRNPGALADGFPTFENSPDRVDRQLVDRHRHERQREQRPAAHGVHVRNGIGRGDGAEVEGIVDDRHEEVRRRDNRLVFADAVHRRIVAGLDPDQQIGGSRPLPPDRATICCSTAGASLQPQPPPWERLVSRTVIVGNSGGTTGIGCRDVRTRSDDARGM